MLLLTKENQKSLPPLYSTESTPAEDKIVQVKYFATWGRAKWLCVEFDPIDGVFFGYCDLFGTGDGEWGYVSLAELEECQNTRANIERDMYFTPKRFADCVNEDGRITA